MKLSLYTVVIILCVISCKKDIPIEDNINLVDKPLKVLKAYTSGNFELKYVSRGFSQRFDTLKNVYVRINGDSIIFLDNGRYFRSKLSWKQITNARQKSTFAMIYSSKIPLPPMLCPEAVEDGLLVLVEDGPDPNGYYLERK